MVTRQLRGAAPGRMVSLEKLTMRVDQAQMSLSLQVSRVCAAGARRRSKDTQQLNSYQAVQFRQFDPVPKRTEAAVKGAVTKRTLAALSLARQARLGACRGAKAEQ